MSDISWLVPQLLALQELLRTAQASGSRSSALAPLQWFLGLAIAGLVAAARYAAPDWVLLSLGCVLAVATASFVGAYAWFMFKSPDALRSEKYSLSKMALERAAVGDSQSGLLQPADTVKRLGGGPGLG